MDKSVKITLIITSATVAGLLAFALINKRRINAINATTVSSDDAIAAINNVAAAPPSYTATDYLYNFFDAVTAPITNLVDPITITDNSGSGTPIAPDPGTYDSTPAQDITTPPADNSGIPTGDPTLTDPNSNTPTDYSLTA